MAGIYATLSVMFGIVTPVLAMVGLISLIVLGLLRTPKGYIIAPKLLGMALEALIDSRNAILIRRGDGNYVFKKANYDAQNQGYWVEDDKQKQFYEGGQDSGNFYGLRLVTAYDGLGAVSDFAASEIAYRAKQKYVDGIEEDLETAEGDEFAINNTEVAIPSRAVIDLRKIRYMSPFNIEPEKCFRVEENAKLSMSKFNNMSTVAQGMLIIAAFTMGIILTWFLLGQGGGGGTALPI